SSTTATRISGPSAFTASMLFMKALQFVAPAPERRDMDVVAWAHHGSGSRALGSMQTDSIQGIARLGRSVAHALLRMHRVGVAAPAREGRITTLNPGSHT